MVGHLGDQLGLLADHRHLVVELDRVVRADLGAEAVLERGDDPTAVGVVLRVRARHDERVQRQSQHVAADLDVALLHHVEHRDLDPLGEVGQLVDRDDPAVRPRDQPEVDRLGVTEAATFRDLHRVDVADQVRDARVRGGQLLGVPLVAVPPRDAQVVAVLGDRGLGAVGDRLVGVLAQLGAGDHGRPLVEQADQGAQQSGLALAALAEQHDVVPGQQRSLELRDHRVVEAVEAGPGVAALAQGGQQVAADLGTEGLVLVAALAELAQGGDGGRGRHVFHATERRNHVDPSRRCVIIDGWSSSSARAPAGSARTTSTAAASTAARPRPTHPRS